MARSPVLADMILENPVAENLNLVDIPVKVFKIVLDFIYNDTAPPNDVNLIEIYAAAGRLAINELKNFTAAKLMDQVDEINAYEVLVLSNKYGSVNLMMKAFEHIKKIFPDKNLGDEFARQPDKIRKLLDMKRKMDEEFESLRLEVEGVSVANEEL
jgi:BTB/POZ domain